MRTARSSPSSERASISATARPTGSGRRRSSSPAAASWPSTSRRSSGIPTARRSTCCASRSGRSRRRGRGRCTTSYASSSPATTRPRASTASSPRCRASCAQRGTPQHQAIVTTNYDDALERAFDEAGEAYDVVWYIADGEHRGTFWHRPPDGEPRLIERPKLYDGLALEERTAIVKIHGAVDRAYPERDSYVITEDHYIDYLTKTEVAQLLPAELLVRLTRSRFLFLGYSMQDWNLRVILHRIWGQQPLAYKSWAIQKGPSEIEQELWRVRGVDVLDIPLEEYVTELESRLHAGRRSDR